MSVADTRASSSYEFETRVLKQRWVEAKTARRRSRVEEEVLELHSRLVNWAVHRYLPSMGRHTSYRVELEDVRQEARLQLLVAFRTWDPGSSDAVEFGTWAAIYLRKVGTAVWKVEASDFLTHSGWSKRHVIARLRESGMSAGEVAAELNMAQSAVDDVYFQPFLVSGNELVRLQNGEDLVERFDIEPDPSSFPDAVEDQVSLVEEMASLRAVVVEMFSEDHWEAWEQRVYANRRLKSIGADYGLSREALRIRINKVNSVIQHPLASTRWPTVCTLLFGSRLAGQKGQHSHHDLD